MLGQALEKTKQVGIAIGDELDEHKRLLDNLETEVDKNQRVCSLKIIFNCL